MRNREGLLGLAAVLLMSSAAHAQTTGSQAGAQLEEVVVTAQKRSENLQQVPVAITAVTAQSLARSGISSTQSLSFVAPSLVYSRTGAYAQPFLRGIGSELTIPNADPSVTTYVDGVVVSSTAGLIQDLLGVDRVEVASGPQGTLNGRNATAGAISIFTLTPNQTPEASVKATYGNYDNKELSGYLSGGLGENFALGVYAAYSDRDSYLKQLGNPLRPKTEHGWGGRVKGVFTPNDDVKLTGSVEYTKSWSMEAGAFRNVQNPNLGTTLGVPNAVQPPYVVNNGPNTFSGLAAVNNTTFAATLREEVDFGWARLLGITGYRNLKSVQGNDLDGTPLAIVEAVSLPGRSKQFSQEIQLISPDDSKVKWIAGAYYLHEDAGLRPVGILSDVIFPAPINGSWNDTHVVLNSYAVFAQITYPVTDQLNLTVGGRYTVDRKVWNVTGWFSTGPSYAVIPGTTTVYPEQKRTFKNFTPKVTLDYRFNDQAMVYATFARGYKAGAFNISSPSLPVMPPAVNPEKLDDYEIGFKTQLLDNRLRLNGAGYYYDYSNIQTSVITTASGGSTVLQNAASAELYGIEGSASAVLTQDFRVNANLAWEHTKYKRFPNASSTTFSAAGNGTGVFNNTGNELARAPKWVGSLSAEYDHELASGGSVNASANLLYNGGFYWEPTNRFKQSAYTIINAQAGYTFPGDHLTVSAFVNNLTDKYRAQAFVLLPTATGTMDAPPRMYGVSLRWKM